MPITKLKSFIQSLVCDTDTVHMFWHHDDTSNKTIKDHNHTAKSIVKRWLPNQKAIHNIQNIQWSHRLIHDSFDIQNLQTANKMAAVAFENVLQNLSSYKTENQIHASLKQQVLSQSYFGDSFPAIVASGKNACTLHYVKNNSPLDLKDCCLIDFGVRFHSMISDISRTFPLSGTFNPLQAIIYNVVLAAQLLVESHVKPNITIDQLNEICWKYIDDEVRAKLAPYKANISQDYEIRPHNVSHFIGIQVHDGDPFRSYRNESLKPGMVISNEPGFYGHITCTINGHVYSEYIGIRIEDNLLITENGCENLSNSIPKTIDEIEALII